MLGSQHEFISNAFAAKLTQAVRCEHAQWTQLTTGAPVLEDALVSFDCEIDQIQQVGTHSVFICRVVDIKLPETQDTAEHSLVYFNRSYHQLGQLAEVATA